MSKKKKVIDKIVLKRIKSEEIQWLKQLTKEAKSIEKEVKNLPPEEKP